MDGGFGGILSRRRRRTGAMAVAGAVEVFKRATSLGGVESLIEPRRRMEGPSSPVPPDLLRLSIGLETTDDLVADLESALDTVAHAGASAPPSVAEPGGGACIGNSRPP
jgi:cystathionine gamma-synthase